MDKELLLRVAVEALSSELRATEGALAHWRSHATRLHAQVRALRQMPDNSMGAPRSMLPSASLGKGRPREISTSSFGSLASMSTYRPRRELPSQPEESPLMSVFRREFWDPAEATAMQRRHASSARIQSAWRGLRQRTWYASARAFFAVVSGVVELTSSHGKSVPAYTLTVVRGGHCWQVSHRFSDWLELDRQLAAKLPAVVSWTRPALPSRFPFRSSSLTSHRQFALNAYLHKMLQLVEGHPKARRTLLNFVSRSHMHWTYANDAVLLTPATAARLEEIRSQQARELARAVMSAGRDPPAHQLPLTGGAAGRITPRTNGACVYDGSTGGTTQTAVHEQPGPRRGLLG